MKKIGVLTFARVANFGAVLQGMSTYHYLKNKNIIPYMIIWEPNDFELRHQKEIRSPQAKKIFDYYDEFFENSQICRDEVEIGKCIEDNNLDGVIIGGDAVLQHHPWITRVVFPCKKIITVDSIDSARLFPNPFWGTFRKFANTSIPLVLMSVSSQNSPYKSFGYKCRQRMYRLLSNFSYVSVRDEWTQKMVRYLSEGKINPPITPDPVFFFNNNLSECIPSFSELKSTFNLPDKYILISFLFNHVVSPEWINSLEIILKQKGITLIALPMPLGVTFDNKLSFKLGTITPIEWYGLIKYSLGYIGQNMHPLIVALHNGVPFYSFDSYGHTKYSRLKCIEQSSKIYHILQDFDCLKNRCCIATRYYKLPSPEEVVHKLETYDRVKILKIAVKKQKSYNQMMEDILAKF